jgi:branched-chain amino acid transport system substrate-binding protein
VKRKALFGALLMLFLVLPLAGAILVSACARPVNTASTPAANEVRIGLLLPLTGKDAELARPLRNALESALYLENWQVEGRPVKIVIEDEGAGDSAIALEKAKKLIQSDRVNVIIGPYNRDAALSVLSYTSSVPIINLKWTEAIANQSELGNKYAFWTAPLLQDDTFPLGLYAYSQGIQRVSVLGTNDDRSLDFVQGFKDAFKLYDGRVVQEQWAGPGDINLTPYLAKITPAQALVCAMAGDDIKKAFYDQYFASGQYRTMPTIFAETSSLSQTLIQSMGDMLVGSLGVEKYLPESTHPENARFRFVYEKQFGQAPPDFSVEAYNCMRVLLEALKTTHGDPKPDVLKQALLKLEFELPTGTFLFSDGRVGVRTIYVRHVVKDKGQLTWEVLREYSMMATHQQTYP